MEKIKKTLIKLGLKEKEIKIYLAILSLGKCNVSEISRKTKIKRTGIYQYLEDLLKKDFVYQTTNKKRILYSAYRPKKIISYLEKEKRSLERKQNNIKKIIPELESLFSESFKKPNIVFLEGKNGLWEAFLEITNTWQPIYQIFSPESFFKIFSFEDNHELLMKLKERDIKLYGLVEESDTTQERLKRKEYNSFVKNKLLPAELKFKSDLLVTGDKLVLVSYKNLTAVIIKDKAIADMQRNFLKFVWKSL